MNLIVILKEDAADTSIQSFFSNYFAEIRYHGKTNCLKNLQCNFCDRSFTDVSTSFNSKLLTTVLISGDTGFG